MTKSTPCCHTRFTCFRSICTTYERYPSLHPDCSTCVGLTRPRMPVSMSTLNWKQLDPVVETDIKLLYSYYYTTFQYTKYILLGFLQSRLDAPCHQARQFKLKPYRLRSITSAVVLGMHDAIIHMFFGCPPSISTS